MADERRPKKADYKIQGQASKPAVDPRYRGNVKSQRDAKIDNVRAHQIPETATVDDLVKALDQRNATGFIKVTELCSALIEEFGGLRGYVKQIKEVFDATESGHLKARMLESQIKLITSVNKMMGEDDPVDTLTDEDLAREAKSMFDKFFGVATAMKREHPDGQARADVGQRVAEIPQADGGVGEAAVGSPESIPPPPEDGAVPRVEEEDPFGSGWKPLE